MRPEILIVPGDLDIMWRTILMEARGEPYEGKVAVGNVIINRVVYRANDRWCTVAQACLDWLQFSGWREKDSNFRVAMTAQLDAVALTCLRAACEALTRPDTTSGSRHYYAPGAMVPKGSVPPWAVGLTPIAKIGGQLFFNNVA